MNGIHRLKLRRPPVSYTHLAVGLAQNLSALRALTAEGIQRGHMALHARQVALAAGALPDQVDQVAAQLIGEGQIRSARAAELVSELQTR